MVKKKNKILHNSSEPRTLTHKRSIKEMLADDVSMLFPTMEDWREALCNTIIKWAAKEDSILMKQFFHETRLNEVRFYEWARKYPDVANALQAAKTAIFIRRYVGLSNRKYADIVNWDLYRYADEWDEVNRYRAAMAALSKEKEDAKGNVFNITMATPEVIGKEQLQSITDEINAKLKKDGDEDTK